MNIQVVARFLVLKRERATFDLKLAMDAGTAAHLTEAQMARIRRARHEVTDLLAELESDERGS